MESNLNIYRFKYFILILFLIISISPCFSDDNSNAVPEKHPVKSFFSDVNFSLGTGLSYLSGQYREIVYPSSGWTSPYLSELLWNLDNIFLLNFDLGASKGPWSLELSMSTAITSETGEMTDTDWLNPASNVRTHWSLSRIWLDNSFRMGIEINHSFQLTNRLSIPIGLGYKLNFWDWEDKVLDFIYPDPQPPDFTGMNGIDYKVIQNIFYASSGFFFTAENFSTGLTISLSPLIYAWDQDHHILTNTYYFDSFLANFWYRAELSIAIKLGKDKHISLSTFREELPESAGDIFQYDESASNPEEIGTQTGYSADSAGLASFLWGIGLSYIWTF